MATVYSELFFKFELWTPYLFYCHSSGGIILLSAKYIATVQSYLSYRLGLWSHSFGGIIPFIAKHIATVWYKSLFYILG